MSTSEYTTKRCSKCKRELPATVEFFWRDKSHKDGFATACRDCKCKHPVSRIPDGFRQCTRCEKVLPETADHFRLRIFRGQFFSQCHECERQRDAELRANNPDKTRLAQRRFKERNPERAKAIKQKWNAKNIARRAELGRKRYTKERDNLLRYGAEYRANNREKVKARIHRRRAAMRNAEGSHTKQELQDLYETQDGRCGYCGMPIYWDVARDMHLDHMTPLSRGGTNYIDNICLACEACNLGKGAKTLEDWMVIRGW